MGIELPKCGAGLWTQPYGQSGAHLVATSTRWCLHHVLATEHGAEGGPSYDAIKALGSVLITQTEMVKICEGAPMCAALKINQNDFSIEFD